LPRSRKRPRAEQAPAPSMGPPLPAGSGAHGHLSERARRHPVVAVAVREDGSAPCRAERGGAAPSRQCGRPPCGRPGPAPKTTTLGTCPHPQPRARGHGAERARRGRDHRNTHKERDRRASHRPRSPLCATGQCDADPPLECTACSDLFWWCRGCGEEQRTAAMLARGFDPAYVARVQAIVRGGRDPPDCDLPMIPCLVCNPHGVRPANDPYRRRKGGPGPQDFWQKRVLSRSDLGRGRDRDRDRDRSRDRNSLLIPAAVGH
jgi:hypothetical protein